MSGGTIAAMVPVPLTSPPIAENSSRWMRLRGEYPTGPIEHEVLVGRKRQDVFTDSNAAPIYNGGTVNALDPQYRNVLSIGKVC